MLLGIVGAFQEPLFRQLLRHLVNSLPQPCWSSDPPARTARGREHFSEGAGLRFALREQFAASGEKAGVLNPITPSLC